MKSRSQPEAPWLSVAMPVHAGERWLVHTLDSVVAQDCAGVEFLVFDSSSDDACERIVKRFADRLDIRYERMPDVTSWPAKTNLAVERARAAHVAMLHQDDLWLPNRAAAAREAIATFPDAALLLNPSCIIDERGRRLGLWRCPLPENQPLATLDVAEPLLVQNFISIPAPIVRRSAWLDCGGMDEALWYTADWDLYLKLVREGPAVYCQTPSTAFRVHSNSLTVAGSRDRSGFEAQMRAVLERHIGLIPSHRRSRIAKRARASIVINCALADAAAGRAGALMRAMRAVFRLGPVQALHYVSDSRILDRAWPRLRARLAGSF
jgi:glycosyltransferase involved in cell wall biosynthesis